MSNPASGKPEDEAAFLVELGRRVRQARRLAGLTRRQLAEQSGLSERYLAQLEGGEGNISVLLIRRVARVLRSDLQYLLTDQSGPADHPADHPAEPVSDRPASEAARRVALDPSALQAEPGG